MTRIEHKFNRIHAKLGEFTGRKTEASVRVQYILRHIVNTF